MGCCFGSFRYRAYSFKLDTLRNESRGRTLQVIPDKRALLPQDGCTSDSRRASQTVKPSYHVMISYSHSDKEFMNKLKDRLNDNGIAVWVDVEGLAGGVDFFTKIGEAIVDAKLFIPIISEDSIQSRFCQDELALAYVSSKPIFPIGLDAKKKLFTSMGNGQRLQLARFKWTICANAGAFDNAMADLIEQLQTELQQQTQETTCESNNANTETSEEECEGPKYTSRPKFYRRQTSVAMMPPMDDDEVANKYRNEDPHAFWSRLAGDEEHVIWEKFYACIESSFTKELISGLDTTEDTAWLASILHRELEVSVDQMGEHLVQKSNFVDFCTVEGKLFPLWMRMKEEATISYAMEGIFNMQSHVRLNAIENLAKFRTPAVMQALTDLLKNKDADVRAIAAISLARTGVQDEGCIDRLMQNMQDKDRLVRESTCIALGRLGTKQAIPKLAGLWRNDVISVVREAAERALRQIGGPEVEKTMHVTDVLGQEIRMMLDKTDKP